MEENSQTEEVTTRSAGIRYGLVLGVVSILFFLLLMMFDVNIAGPARWISWVIYVVMIFLAHKYYKDNGSGFMAYGQGIGIAFWMALIGSLISSIFSYVYMKFVDAGFIDKMKEMQVEQFQERGMSDEQIDQAMKFSEMFMNPEVMLVMGIVGGIVSLVIVALLVTIFTQKKSPEPFA